MRRVAYNPGNGKTGLINNTHMSMRTNTTDCRLTKPDEDALRPRSLRMFIELFGELGRIHLALKKKTHKW